MGVYSSPPRSIIVELPWNSLSADPRLFLYSYKFWCERSCVRFEGQLNVM